MEGFILQFIVVVLRLIDPIGSKPKADIPDKQVCYLNGQNNNHLFNVFVSKRINQLTAFIFKLIESEIRLIVKRLTQMWN